MVDEDEERLRVRRGAEHVRVITKGTTEELGEIIPPPVIAVPVGDRDDEPEGAEHVELDDGEEIGR